MNELAQHLKKTPEQLDAQIDRVALKLVQRADAAGYAGFERPSSLYHSDTEHGDQYGIEIPSDKQNHTDLAKSRAGSYDEALELATAGRTDTDLYRDYDKELPLNTEQKTRAAAHILGHLRSEVSKHIAEEKGYTKFEQTPVEERFDSFLKPKR